MREKLLVIEDSAPIRDVLEIALSSFDYQVTTANNGLEGLAQVLRSQFDLALVDVLMPEMNGIEFYKALRKMQQPQGRMPVIFLTAAPTVVQTKYLEDVEEEVIEKPFDLDKLEQRIREKLRGAKES